MADFTWKGFDWWKRDYGGDPMYNGQYLTANVSAPDGNDYITLSITNPTGTSPHAAEMYTDLTNFGYGTYTIVVGSRLDTLPKAAVFGGLFTYADTGSGDTAITNNEIDVNETSAWGVSGGTVNTSHNYFKNVGGVKTGEDDPYTTTADTVTTHVMTWLAGSITFDSYVGTGTGGTNIKHTVATTNIPNPSLGATFMDINLWVFGDGAVNPDTTPATDVIIRDISFTPYLPAGSTGSFFFQ